ncbi:MAG TPA: hypothetical protein VNK52_16060 [Hyphomicrobiaceae bacterium]|nr:hypothetical protein [Hyphomicrobiaceae bacterium]
MSFNFGKQEQTSRRSERAQQDPWDVAIPGLQALINRTTAEVANVGATPAQVEAARQLRETLGQGNPFAADIERLTADLFGANSRAPTVEAAYSDLTRRLTPTAEGQFLDFQTNPFVERMLQQVGNDITQRVNAQFAAAGRDLSGGNTQAVARGVTQGQLPILADLYNTERNRQLGAAGELFDAAKTTATTAQGLDTDALATRASGIDAAKAALEARGYGPTAILAIEEQLKRMPVDDLRALADILFGAGALGQQTEGTATGRSETSGQGFGFNLGRVLFGRPF